MHVRYGQLLYDCPWLILASDILKSPIDGKLIATKDNICTTEASTTCGSAILADFRSPYQATVIEKLQAAGGITFGKTNLDEFGMG